MNNICFDDFHLQIIIHRRAYMLDLLSKQGVHVKIGRQHGVFYHLTASISL